MRYLSDRQPPFCVQNPDHGPYEFPVLFPQSLLFLPYNSPILLLLYLDLSVLLTNKQHKTRN